MLSSRHKNDDVHSKKRYFTECGIGFYYGKSGILEGGKGDIMIPNAHINEGTADNYFSIMN
jgi:hypothetical protein